MDISPAPTNTNATKSPETDTTDHHQTGGSRIQSAKPLTFTNGILKRHQPQPQHRRHPHHPIVVTYKECLKNHAASLGGLALDGCGEFMPSPTATPSYPTSLKCAACGCHRNFHRREPDQELQAHAHTPTTATIEYQPHHRHRPPPPVTQPPVATTQRSPNSASPPPISSSYYPSAPHMLLALSGNLQQQSSAAAAAAQQEQSNNNNFNNNNNNMMLMSNSGGRKRFRTKFSQSQKEKMYEFAERVGWKMQKRDEDLVHEFCNEVGVDRTVLKVWMHNNKSTLAKRDLNSGSASASASASVGGGIGRINLDDDTTGSKNSKIGDGDDHENGDNGVQNLNHQFESTTTGSCAHLVNANGGGGSSSSS